MNGEKHHDAVTQGSYDQRVHAEYARRHFEYLFFFQAEDGIRDVAVTGVQTCALPISRSGRFSQHGMPASTIGSTFSPGTASRLKSVLLSSRENAPLNAVSDTAPVPSDPAATDATGAATALRSEERRVGKVCGTRWVQT